MYARVEKKLATELSVHITTTSYQKIPPGSDVVNKRLALMYRKGPNYVEKEHPTKGSKPKGLGKLQTSS